MRLPRVMTRRWVVVLALVVLSAALAVWIIRPRSLRAWLDALGFSEVEPLAAVLACLDLGRAPFTPLGLASLVPASELLIAGALVTAIVALALVLAAPPSAGGSGAWLTGPIGELRFPRPRLSVRAMLILIAIVGLGLGWEMVGWRRWRGSQRYFARANHYGSVGAQNADDLARSESLLARLEAGHVWWAESDLTPAARAAERAYQRDLIRERADHDRAIVALFGQLRQKYQAAASDPLTPVEPDPPPPERPEGPWLWRARKEYAHALAGFDELIRRYPDLVGAHLGRAQILATCPDAGLRDGAGAVASATRACELTTWNNVDALSALAAAYAEAGDFARAVEFEQKAHDLGSRRTPPERMAAYRAGKPYRDPR